MRVENREKMLEKLATSDRIAIVIERQPDGKKRVTSGSWHGEKVLMRDSGARGPLCDKRRPAAHRSQIQADPPSEPYDPYGPGMTGNAFDVIDD
jgi:hypothetical protein